MGPYIPQLDGKIDPAAARAIRDLFEKYYALEGNQNSQARAIAATPSKTTVAQQFMSRVSSLPGFSFLQTGNSSFISKTQGSIMPTVLGQLLYDNATANAVKWYSIGLQLSVPSREVINVVDTSVPNPIVAVTGLPIANYVFYPKYNINLRVVQFSMVAGGVGTPAIAYALRNDAAAIDQSADGFFNLASGGIMAAATGGGGAGGGGGGSDCPRQNMIVRELTKGLMRAGHVKRGDIIATNRGFGWTMVTYAGLIPCSLFTKLSTDNGEIEQSPETPMRMADGHSLFTSEISQGDYINTYQGRRPVKIDTVKELDYKVLMRCWPHHEFLCGAGFPSIETHNSVAPK
jgi:hypothetical protein